MVLPQRMITLRPEIPNETRLSSNQHHCIPLYFCRLLTTGSERSSLTSLRTSLPETRSTEQQRYNLLPSQRLVICRFVQVMRRAIISKLCLVYCVHHWSVLSLHMTTFLRCELAIFVVLLPELTEWASSVHRKSMFIKNWQIIPTSSPRLARR